MAVNHLLCFSSFVFGMAGHVSGKSILAHSTGLLPPYLLSSQPLTFKRRTETGIFMEVYMLTHHNPYTHRGATSAFGALHIPYPILFIDLMFCV